MIIDKQDQAEESPRIALLTSQQQEWPEEDMLVQMAFHVLKGAILAGHELECALLLRRFSMESILALNYKNEADMNDVLSEARRLLDDRTR